MKRTWLLINKCLCLASVLCMFTTGCKKLVQVDEPDDSLTTSAVFSNDSLAQAAVTGLYIKIMTNSRFFLNGGMSLYPGLSADELQRTFTLTAEDQFFNNAINTNNTLIYVNLWKAAYAYIYQCNVCLEGLNKSNSVSNGLKKQLQGEVLFVRALCYFYLVNCYGAVPLALSTNADVNAMLPRKSVEEVYKQIEGDLLAANDALLSDKPSTTPTKFATQALLARVYLYMKNWGKAAEMASAVIDSRQFSLEGDLADVFKKDGKETIFQWAPVIDRINSAEGFIFVPSSQSVRPTYMLTKELLNSFEVGDLRRSKWVNSLAIGGVTYYYPYKFRIFTSSTSPQEYNVVLRLAEQYLIRAEAQAQQNNISNAIIDINSIRTRAGLPVFSTTVSKDECLQKIEQERRIELFAEWGHRWFDLKRTNRANSVLGSKGSSWTTEDQLYPIPLTELEVAPNLKQNPGYE
ncbi:MULTISPECIES: RagB/SusD family nutrient uptake outer membrane protein [Niastella]|uniref:RagB/SusD family nutrient uptake outer membrane protein n=1 Tax=Niastella soli TaxID=2821487 RepID=A0ABS3Z6B3_9BACT|nr:RagB/SusD family nutrient uptake outer membrane protein [Niastella soli]MBO9205001.1 RagB/SusD family nutrient uptake outer membrane protein [Niastella soli]